MVAGNSLHSPMHLHLMQNVAWGGLTPQLSASPRGRGEKLHERWNANCPNTGDLRQPMKLF